jgi:hypothetical protein
MVRNANARAKPTCEAEKSAGDFLPSGRAFSDENDNIDAIGQSRAFSTLRLAKRPAPASNAVSTSGSRPA